jgi:hypothetical protein
MDILVWEKALSTIKVIASVNLVLTIVLVFAWIHGQLK